VVKQKSEFKRLVFCCAFGELLCDRDNRVSASKNDTADTAACNLWYLCAYDTATPRILAVINLRALQDVTPLTFFLTCFLLWIFMRVEKSWLLSLFSFVTVNCNSKAVFLQKCIFNRDTRRVSVLSWFKSIFFMINHFLQSH